MVFSYEPGGQVPPYPDTLSHAFSSLRDRAGVAADVHLHSVPHFQSTELGRMISDSHKQARLGWSTVRSTWDPSSADCFRRGPLSQTITARSATVSRLSL